MSRGRSHRSEFEAPREDSGTWGGRAGGSPAEKVSVPLRSDSLQQVFPCVM